eukprot:CAMPEP_0116921450 /NCGR_PEP_ID=MMETSP0467-20121206/21637_1 /TAXON_ID=283647 /ORGANISM="Mesodinium pulex, Strain SPMC105" /LENGTH=137 /DNA_ID=CAMNT_0004599519 /DNA_START=66 /DNA_END=481 /DNA_ORIENTATION=-
MHRTLTRSAKTPIGHSETSEQQKPDGVAARAGARQPNPQGEGGQVERHHESFEKDRINYEESLNNRFVNDRMNLAKQLQDENKKLAEQKRNKEQNEKNENRNKDLLSCTSAQIEQPVNYAPKSNAQMSNEYLSLPRN